MAIHLVTAPGEIGGNSGVQGAIHVCCEWPQGCTFGEHNPPRRTPLRDSGAPAARPRNAPHRLRPAMHINPASMAIALPIPFSPPAPRDSTTR